MEPPDFKLPNRRKTIHFTTISNTLTVYIRYDLMAPRKDEIRGFISAKRIKTAKQLGAINILLTEMEVVLRV